MELEKIVRELIEYPTEANWFEFKENWYEPIGIGNTFHHYQMRRH